MKKRKGHRRITDKMRLDWLSKHRSVYFYQEFIDILLSRGLRQEIDAEIRCAMKRTKGEGE